MATSTSTSTTTTTTTTTMRPSQRVLLEAFPAPPSHIPPPPNLPPSGPPTQPLPPVPGPSRVSVDEQLLFLARRSSKYSVASSSHRDSVISVDSPRSPSFFIRPSLTRSPNLLSDIEDDELEPIPARMPSPFLDSSWRRSKHHQNESISSIDVRAILNNLATHPHSAPPTASFSHVPMPTSPTLVLSPSSSSDSPSSSFLSSDSSLSDPAPALDDFNPSATVKDLRLGRRAERTKSPALRRVLAIRSRSRPKPSFEDTDNMTLDDLGPLPPDLDTRPRPVSPSRPHSPDIESILSTTPRPVLRKAASQSRLRPQGTIPDYRRRASEGLARSTPSWHDDVSLPQRNRALSLGISPDDVDESDSSIDLHTPLPRLMVRDGLLSSNSRLLPISTRRRDGRSDSVLTACSTLTKTGIMKDERDTPMRRVRHRDNRLLKGGIGLTTGLGWSDSEDEDAPSPLTRRLSTLNLSRRSSASSVRTTSSVVSHHRHPLSRSYSSGALIESEFEHLEEDVDENTTIVAPPALRPRLSSAGRSSKPALPPTSWLNKAATAPNGTRTSTSSIGSTFSVDTALSDGMPRRPSKLGRPSSGGFRDSSGSSENYGSSLRRKGSSGIDRTSSSTTASTLSTGIPSTPRDYDPSMSTPAGFGSTRSYNTEKSLPPIPYNLLKKRPSNSRIDTLSSSFSFPRARTFSATSSSVPSPTSPSSASPVRPLQLPRQAGVSGSDRAAVPVPSVLPSPSISKSSLRLPATRSPAPDKTASGIRPRPRTGTGMMYRTSSGSRIKAPMTLASSTSLLERNNALSEIPVVGSIGRAKTSRIPPV